MTYNAINQYANAIAVTSKTNQIIMLYEGIINSLKKAQEAIDNKDYTARYNCIKKSIDIINGLDACLNHEYKETAASLSIFYNNIIIKLTNINVNNLNSDSLNVIIEDIRGLRDAWVEVSHNSSIGEENQDKMTNNNITT